MEIWWLRLPSSAGGAGLMPGQGTKISPAFWPKNPKKYTSNVVTNSIKTIKMAHFTKKKIFKNENKNKSPGSH